MEVGEGEFFHQGPGQEVVLLRLTGEAGNEVGPQAQHRYPGGHLQGTAAVHLPGVPAAHAPQDTIGATLEGHVEVGGQPASGALHELQEDVVHLCGLHTPKAKTDSGHLLQEEGNQAGQGEVLAQVPSVMPDVDPREDQFRVAQAEERGLRHHLIR